MALTLGECGSIDSYWAASGAEFTQANSFWAQNGYKQRPLKPESYYRAEKPGYCFQIAKTRQSLTRTAGAIHV